MTGDDSGAGVEGWALESGRRHLNHGSFGAVLEEVLRAQDVWRHRFEADPTRFVFEDLQPAVDAARQVLGEFVGADPSGLAPVRNATTGIASVLRSLEPALEPGDQILTTAHDYNAVRQILRFTAERTGAEVAVARVPFPIGDTAEVTGAITAAVTERTRLAVIDHVTSPTALVFPIEAVASSLEPDIPVLVDGAHGPGQVPLSLDELGASWYTGNLHKWVCAPKGAAFLHTRSDRIEMTMPAIISHGLNADVEGAVERYHALFDWLGTDDFSSWAVLPDVLRVVGGLQPGGWEGLMKRNHDLILDGRRIVSEAVGTELPAPDHMIGSMASIVLPEARGVPAKGDLSPLMGELSEEGFSVIVQLWPGWPHQLIRISAHLYNSADDYLALADRLRLRFS